MAVGWMVGGWLYNTLSTSNEGGMQPMDMPQFNRALRGTPIFVTFGANRVWAQIPWAKNWTPHEQEASGKGGGSGGGKGGAAGGASYTYTWDIMYNFGFVDQPSFIRTAWNGSDVVTFETLEAWNANITSITGLFSTLFSLRHTQKSDSAALEADEVFFAPGWPTGHANIESWSYFGTQENSVRCQWPYTAWLGFKQLDLGASGVTPQISVELVPLTGAEITNVGDFISRTQVTDVGSSLVVDPMPTNSMMMVGEDGKHYAIANFATTGFHLIGIEDSTETLITVAMINDALTTLGSSLAGDVTTQGDVIGAPGTPYFIVRNAIVGANIFPSVTVFKIDITGTIVPHKYIASRCSGLQHGQWQTFNAAAVFDDVLYICPNQFESLSVRGQSIVAIPLLTASFDDITGNTWVINFVYSNLTGLGDEFFNASVWNISQRCTIVRTSGVLGILTYVNQGTVDSGTSAGNTLLDGLTAPALIHCEGATVTTLTTLLSDNLTDRMLKYDDTASSDYADDYTSPNNIIIGDTQFLIWTRGFTTKAEFVRVHISMWTETLADAITFLTEAEGQVLDMVVDLGATEPNRNLAYPREVQGGYNEDTSELWVMGAYSPAITDCVAFSKFGPLIPFGGQPDVTPPYIISRILTHAAFGVSVSALFGFSVTADSLDAASYADSVVFCEDEGIKVATTYTTQADLLGTFDTLLALYGGMLVVVGGKIFFKVARDDDDTGRIVNNDHLVVAKAGTPPVTIHEPAIQDSYNQIQYNYIDRALDYKNNQIEISNEVDMDINGPRPKSFPSRFVMAGSLANMLAERALWSNLYGRRMYEFKMGWKDADLMPSDVITLVDSFDVGLSAGRKVRIVRKKEQKRGTYDTVAVDHIPYHITANHVFTNPTSLSDPDSYISSVAPIDFRMYELPKEFQNTSEVYVGYNQHSILMGAQLYLSADGATFNLADNAQPFVVSGIMKNGLPVREPGYMEEFVEAYLMPGSPFSATTPTYCQTTALDEIAEGARASGAGVWIVGSEAIAIQGLTLIGQNHYRARRMFRGWGGTPISTINSGAQWHWHRSGIFELPISEDDVGTILHYKVVPYNFAGQLYNISSVDARTYQIKGLYWLPRHQTPISVWVQTPTAWTRSLPALGPFLAVDSGGCDVALTWAPAAQTAGYGAGGYGTGGYGRFQADITSPQYRVNVYSANGTSVSSFVANTGYFNYTLAQNSADFNQFGKAVIFKVTPYNGLGDGPIAMSRSLSLFW
jgi:hypothetical protein